MPDFSEHAPDAFLLGFPIKLSDDLSTSMPPTASPVIPCIMRGEFNAVGQPRVTFIQWDIVPTPRKGHFDVYGRPVVDDV